MNAQPKQRDDAWHESRKGLITSSRIGAILGLSKYRNREDVMREMVREMHGAPREFDGNEATRYGEAHEGDAIDAYEQRYGTIVVPSPLVPHWFHPWMAASPDGLVGDNGLIECKCPYRARYTTPSDEYVAQMQLQMDCTGRDWCDFVIWREGEPIIVERVDHDPMWLARNIDALEKFHYDFLDTFSDKELAAPYLADKERDDALWRSAAAAYMQAKENAAHWKAQEDHWLATLSELAPQGAKGCGVQLIRSERPGTIQYAKIVKQLVPENFDFSPYTGEPSITYTVKVSK